MFSTTLPSVGNSKLSYGLYWLIVGLWVIAECNVSPNRSSLSTICCQLLRALESYLQKPWWIICNQLFETTGWVLLTFWFSQATHSALSQYLVSQVQPRAICSQLKWTVITQFLTPPLANPQLPSPTSICSYWNWQTTASLGRLSAVIPEQSSMSTICTLLILTISSQLLNTARNQLWWIVSHCHSARFQLMVQWKDLMLRIGQDIGRHGNGMRMLYSGGQIICWEKEVVWGIATSDDAAWLWWYESHWWCIKSWVRIGLLHLSMRYGSRVPDQLHIHRACLALKDFLFFSHYSISCRAMQTDNIGKTSTFVLTQILDANFECLHLCIQHHILVSNITYFQYRLLH